MPITITYKLNNPKLKKATRLANELLASTDLIRVVKSRRTPFNESDPDDLKPTRVAEYIRSSNLALTLCEYTNPKKTVGGMFKPSTPTRIYANRKAVPERSPCNLARMLVHECIHALSKDVDGANFSHDDDHTPYQHRNTAPYWIQAKLKPFCSEVESEGEREDEDVIEVEIVHGDEDLESRNIKCS